ncbi:PREDICTED: transcription initiation factor IIA subunit 1-like [Amphimedon queenslandica]|uniref:Uncharacterized protein n=1 Tax=Amphimedon queenslandica TaxID=400682 RepID=A0A1X7TJL4_AMPQE|nr:PREDICTED: transcription initiation factor IIA subunit 1-like [Amphimedon queenslandica]|eukprot:XP_011407398.2 PREDICTED: transcription initiation factor IIA subunit 1-like [Amphimedon queenslandica]
MSSGQTSLEQMLGVYKWVVDDVMKNVREDFLNEGADTQVLEDLKQLWENKLVQSGALSRPMKPAEAHPIKETISQDKQNKSTQQQQQHSQQPTSSTPAITHSSPASASNTPAASVIQQAPPRPSLSSAMTTPTTSSTVSFTPPLNSSSRSSGGTGGVSQATPSQTPPQITGVGAANTPPFLNMALAQQAIYSAITGGTANPVGGAAATLPVMLPGGGLSLVQHGGIPYAAVPTPTGLQYVPIALNLPGTIPPSTSSETSSSNNITQSDGPRPLIPPGKHSSKETKGSDSNEVSSTEDSSLPVISFELPAGITPSHFFSSSKRKSRSVSHRTGTKDPTSIPQLDGPPPPPDGSSSEDSDESSESDPDDIEGEQEDDEDPLNSEDDAESDEEDDVWETDNTIVCQFEKVYRVRAKWKFALKDGIMHLNGHDYIFTKTAGEAEW